MLHNNAFRRGPQNRASGHPRPNLAGVDKKIKFQNLKFVCAMDGRVLCRAGISADLGRAMPPIFWINPPEYRKHSPRGYIGMPHCISKQFGYVTDQCLPHVQRTPTSALVIRRALLARQFRGY